MGRKKLIDIGKKYGRATLIREAGRDWDGRILVECQCDCGTVFITSNNSLREGLTKSCGCLRKEIASKVNKKPLKFDDCGDYYKVYMRSGKCFLIDKPDIELVKDNAWFLTSQNRVYSSSLKKSLAKVLIGSDAFNIIQFKNGNFLDYRRKNIYTISKSKFQKELYERRKENAVN